jgi:chromosome partitioning protein
MGKIIGVMNQKGGVGKTTTTANLGVGLKNLGKKILVVDLDPQANLTSALGLKHRTLEFTIYNLLKDAATFEQVVVCQNGLYVLPSSVSLSGADIELSNIAGRELLLKEALHDISPQFDCILIDCPPNLGLLTLNALTAANELLIPIQAEYLPLEGMSFLLETVEIVKKRLNKDLKIAGVVVTRYDARQNLHREVVEIIRSHFNDKLFHTLIRSNIALAEAPSFGQDIFTYKPDCAGAKDYASLCEEIINREVI